MLGLRFALLPCFLAWIGRGFVLMGASSLVACTAVPGETWAAALRPDFSTAESTGESFFAAWAVEQPKTEYLALSEAWKAELGASYDAYLIARPQLADEIGWVAKHAWRLKPISREVRGAEVWIWWGLSDEPMLGVRFVEQHYFEFREAGADGRRPGSYLNSAPGDLLELDGSTLYLELNDPLIRSVRSFSDQLQSFELGSEWKIRGFLQVENAADSELQPAIEPPEA